MIGFLVPAFLLGLLAIGIPIALHLRHRDKDRPFRFPSLMFLEQLPIRTAQRRRVTDWPLLLLRALALALLAFAFARPVFTRQALTGSDSRAKAVVLLLDRSQSMGLEGVWQTALDSAKSVIAGLDARDRVGVVFFDDASELAQRLTDDKGAAVAVLGAAKPMPRGTRFAPALRTARQMLLDAPYAAAEIVVISDLQRAGTVGVAGINLPTGVELRAINVGSSSLANSAVRSVEARRVNDASAIASAGGSGAVGSRELLAVKARVTSRALASPRSVAATLVVNGRDAATQTVALTNGEAVVTFPPVPVPESDVSGTVRLATDALPADDQFQFVVPRDNALRVVVMTPEDARADETLFFERALSIGRAPEIVVSRVRVSSLDAATLRTASVVVVWDATPSSSGNAMLRSYVEDGGGLIYVAGSRMGGSARSTGSAAANPATANSNVTSDPAALLPVKFTGIADRLADRGGTLTGLRLEHPLFAPFRDAGDALLVARFLRYPRMDVLVGGETLARFDDGLPAIVERKLGAGRIVLTATALDATSSDFALQPAFLPFLRQLMMHTSGRDAAPLWRSTADNWSLPLAIKDPVVRAPDESLLRPAVDTAGSSVLLADAGHYLAFSGVPSGEARAVVAVNVPASESDLTPIDPTELLLGVRTSETVAAGDSVPPTPDALERRQSAWRFLIALVALALVGETFMATRGWRAVARRYPPAVPDRSSL